MINTLLQLQNLRNNNKLPHAFILTGLAADLTQQGLDFAAWALCAMQATATAACGQCHNCTLLAAHTLADFLQIEPDPANANASIKIEQVRQLIQFAATQPQFAAKKIALIQQAESLNVQAANAMLKILEEPPDNLHIILITSSPKLLINTVLSRCPIFNLTQASADTALESQLLADLLADLYSILVLKNILFVAVIEKWQRLANMELVSGLWLVIAELINYKLNKPCSYSNLVQPQLAELGQMQSLSALWPILDSITALRKYILLGRQVNSQLFLENLLHNWSEEIKHGRRNCG